MVRSLRPLRILVLLHPELVPPDSLKGYSDKEIHVFKTEYDVVSTLRSRGHDVRPLGLKDELKPIRDAIEGWTPHVVFNLLEEFHGQATYDQNVASFLELLRLPYTGCNPRGLMLARGKALSKKLTSYHRVPTPAFTVIPIGRKIVRPARLTFPLIVKSATEDASYGIAQASLVDNEEKLKERVTFIHEKIGTDALIEQYIDGREIYVGVIGNERLRVLPVWELNFGDVVEDGKRIATARVKHDIEYQQRHNVTEGPAKGLAPETIARIQRLAKRICRTLELDGYSRIDFRLAEDGTPYFIEANPNPEIAKIEEFARAAAHDGIKYWALLERICQLGINRTRALTEEAPIAP
jgi:D-alanine-D-alanine ligase